ncbi:MAG: IS66 family insertion sequence element accessory protein TnpB [Pontiella sp.]
MNQNLKVVLAVEPVDLRKSFNGLYAIARSELGEVPENGALFIFSNLPNKKTLRIAPERFAVSYERIT